MYNYTVYNNHLYTHCVHRVNLASPPGIVAVDIMLKFSLILLLMDTHMILLLKAAIRTALTVS